MLKNLMIVGLGGALGSIARFLVSYFMGKDLAWPWPTFAVNILGSFLIGLFSAFLLKGQAHAEHTRLFLITGICGGFTTFSAVEWESFTILREGKLVSVFLYVLISFAVGLLATFLGYKTLH